MKTVLLSCSLLLSSGCQYFQKTDAEGNLKTVDLLPGHSRHQHKAVSERLMIATQGEATTNAGLEMIKLGGNAVDAAIAANAALGLMEPTGNGVGGDLFAIVWDAKTKKLYGLNASGPAPQSLSIEYFKENNLEKIPAYGPLPVSVPGAVDGWIKLHEKFGNKEFSFLFFLVPLY